MKTQNTETEKTMKTETAKHTPAPWDIEGDKIVNNETVQYVADIRRDGETDPEADANARLIAASPSLLFALEEIAWQCDREEDITAHGGPNLAMTVGMIARAAIAKAKGV